MKKINKVKLRAFIQRRKINALGLLMITFMSAVTTIICAMRGFARTDILVMVTAALIVLCMIQEVKLRKGFRTIPSFKGARKKVKQQAE